MATKKVKKAEMIREFEEGDPIVHPSHGAGRLLSIQTWEVDGVVRSYYNIELVNDHGTLMIPVEQAEDAGLRLAISGEEVVKRVLNKAPEELASDHRKRQSAVADKIHSGKAKQVSEALRDLAYRERTEGLTERDGKLKAEAEGLLVGELALSPDLDLDSAALRLHEIVISAMDKHAPIENDE